ncbi:MAG: alpha/beta hydrolase [Burkholderiaceae bacterium]|nr:alpha/beta hydrolase [Burkholderiaceae bacterium]
MRSLAALATLTLAACAAPAIATEPRPEPQTVADTLLIGGTVYDVRWGVPTGEPLALAIVEHGFTRRCDNLRGTLQAWVDAGLMTLCIDASMVAGNPALADALAELLVTEGLTTPGGAPVPARTVVGGHSAGGAFAVRLGWRLAQAAPDRIAGAVLFDPVASGARFVDELRGLAAFGQRPVLAVTANASRCNAQHNAYPGLRAVAADDITAGGDGFVGAQLLQSSTHVDAEGGDSDLLGWVACRQGPPRPGNVKALRELTATWAADVARGVRTPSAYPGGALFERLRNAGRAAPID